MASLLDMMIFDYKRYAEITDPRTRQEMERLAAMLNSLEKEILQYPEGTISILKSGNIFVSSFPTGLKTRIQAMLAGDG